MNDAAEAPEEVIAAATRRHRPVPWVAAVCALIIATQAYSVVQFVRANQPDLPAYDWRMTVDSSTYVRQAAFMLNTRDTFYTDDSLHSVGMQVLAANVFLLTGRGPLAMKLVNCGLWLLTVVLAFLACRRVLPATGAWVTAALIALSIPLQRYCGIVQYEVPVTAALTALFFLNVRPAGVWTAVASGLIVAILAIFRVHFVLLVPALAVVYALWPSRLSRAGYVALLVLGFAVLAVPWNLYYSARLGAPFFFQTGIERQVNRFLSPTSQGFNYPFPQRAPRSGVQFVVDDPEGYARLVLRRFMFLTGIERDIWWIEPRGAALIDVFTTGTTARRANAVAALVLALGGAALTLHPRTRTRAGLLALAIVAVLVAPHAIVNSSTRFMIPAIPLLTFLQAQLVIWLATGRVAREDA